METCELLERHEKWLVAGGYSAETTIPDAIELLRRVNNDLHNVDSELSLGTATEQEINAWVARPGWSAQTRASYRTIIRRFFTYAVDAGYLSFDPSIHLRRPKIPKRLPRPATDEEARRAVTELPEPYRLHCLLAAHQGMRCCEIGRAERDHFDERWVRIVGKGDKVREVPTHPAVWRAVRDMPPGRLTRPREDERDWVSKATSKALERAGIRCRPHQLRHWYATTLTAAGVNIQVVAELLGHESVATTQIYSLVPKQLLRAAVDVLPDMTGGTLPAVTRQGPASEAP